MLSQRGGQCPAWPGPGSKHSNRAGPRTGGCSRTKPSRRRVWVHNVASICGKRIGVTVSTALQRAKCCGHGTPSKLLLQNPLSQQNEQRGRQAWRQIARCPVMQLRIAGTLRAWGDSNFQGAHGHTCHTCIGNTTSSCRTGSRRWLPYSGSPFLVFSVYICSAPSPISRSRSARGANVSPRVDAHPSPRMSSDNPHPSSPRFPSALGLAALGLLQLPSHRAPPPRSSFTSSRAARRRPGRR